MRAALGVIILAGLAAAAQARPAQAQSAADLQPPPAAGAPSPANVNNATVPVPASAVAPAANPDPYEGFNRDMFGIYQALDKAAIRPAAIFYKHATPRPVRTGLRNAFRNLGEPVILVNDVVQVHPRAAGVTLGRILVNSTVGLAGLFDPATGAGLPYHANSFGTTLGRYGAPPGPYLFVPVLGPSDLRDTIGSGVDALADPFTWIRFTGRVGLGVSRTVVGGLDTRAQADPELKEIFATATDPYASIRSLYLQNRQSEISGGQVNLNALPSFGDEPASAPNEAGAPGASAPAPAGGPAPPGDASALPSQSAPTTATPPQPQPVPKP